MNRPVADRFKWLALSVPAAAALSSAVLLLGALAGVREDSNLTRDLLVSGFVIALSAVVARLLYSRIESDLALPVGRLLEAASAVSSQQAGDAAPGALAAILAREPAAAAGGGEFHQAVESLLYALNEKELQIQFRDVQLGREREQLEARVADRTADLTRLMEELRSEKVRAEEAARTKAMFLANMSHEIRTPMNGIIGMADLVLESSLTAQQHECLATIRSSAESLTTIINDVLDFSKIEAGKLELSPAKFNLRESLTAALGPLALGAEGKGLELSCRVLPEVPDALVGDAGRLRQIVVNLVGNSVKFTEHGEIAIHVEIESTMLGQVVVHVAVRDTGIGIGSQEQAALFKPFEQADGSATREYGGTGLGLAIAHQLVALMGGRIWFESQPGKGSTFHFSVRFGLQRAVEEDRAARGAFDLPDRRVLVVDDSATTREILAEQALEWRLEPIHAAGAEAASGILKAAREAGKPIPLAWIDARMPDVDGFALVEQMQTNQEIGTAVVLMLPQSDRLEKSKRERGAGISAYVSKPVYHAELLAATRVALGLEAVPRPEGPPLTPGFSEQLLRELRILLVEDNPVNQAVALRILRPRGHEVTVANDGEEAVAAVAKSTFDVVLMDLSMPRMGGIEATQAIRKTEEGTGRRLRVLALTAHALAGDRERCLKAGMDGYVSKPIRKQQLCSIVEGAPAPAAEPGDKSALPVADAKPSSAAAAHQAGIDRDILLEKFDGNLEAFREIALVYLENCPRFLDNIRAAIASGDMPALVDAAHTIKGTLSIFSVESAFEAALRLEKLARAGDAAEAAAALPPLESEVRRLNAAVGPLLGA